MTPLSKFHGPGYFYVLSQPKSSEYLDEFHEWYNSEHGPLRLKLDFILNGYRYKSQDSDPAVWLATYDLKQISAMDEPRYTSLRQHRSDRESDLINHKMKYLDRRIYKDLSSRGRNGGPAPVVMSVTFVVKDEHVDELNRWYEEEHTTDISNIPGWRRTRRFQLIEADDQREGYTELMAVHDFEKDNGLDGPEHEFAKSRPWRNKVLDLVEKRENRRFDFFHEFGAEDYRHPPAVNGANEAPAVNGVKEAPAVNGVKDAPAVNGDKASATGATSWQLDGAKDGPVIVFSNSLLTDSHLWDGAIEELRSLYPKFRYLRYNTRGYEWPSDDPVTIDLLTDDLALLLDDLDIEKCFAVIGVSLGGITALNFAIRYPTRLERFVACDCNAVSGEKNTQAWKERVALANSDGGWGKLADQTVRRWLTPMSIDGQTKAAVDVKDMVLAGSKAGFEQCVHALCDFDLSQKLSGIKVPGVCLVGAQDGVLPSAMAGFSKSITKATFTEVAHAGHLPMVENPVGFVQAILPLFEPKLTNHSGT